MAMKKNYIQPTIDVANYTALNLMYTVSGGRLKVADTGSTFPVSGGR